MYFQERLKMNDLENFFSTEKIIYPIGFSILFGVIIKIIEYLFNLRMPELIFWIVMGVGFIIGNQLKINFLRNKEKE